jgi:hypothetical protein
MAKGIHVRWCINAGKEESWGSLKDHTRLRKSSHGMLIKGGGWTFIYLRLHAMCSLLLLHARYWEEDSMSVTLLCQAKDVGEDWLDATMGSGSDICRPPKHTTWNNMAVAGKL